MSSSIPWEVVRQRAYKSIVKQHGPLIPKRLALRVINEYSEFETIHALCRAAGVRPRNLWGLVWGEKEFVTFAVFDKIVTKGLQRPELWLFDPELNEVYSQVCESPF